jgi:hypothetical protein
MRKKEIKIINNPNFYFLFFFLFLFFYYLLVFDSYLYYHNHQPIFLFDKTFLKEFLSYPGGPSELITQFFLQFFYFNLLGAFFLSAISLSIFVIIYMIIKKIGDFKYSLIFSFLPVSLLLIIQNHYNSPLMITVKYLFALLFFLVYVKTPERYKVFFIPLSFLIYYLLGGWIYLFYVVLCMLHELLFSRYSRKYIYAVINSLVYFIYPYIAARYLFMIDLKEAYFYLMPSGFYNWPFNFNLNLYLYLFFLSLPVLLIALFVYLKYSKAEIKKRKVKKRKIKKQNSSLAGIYLTLIQSIFIIIAAVLILTFSFELREKKKIQIDYLAEQGRWNKLLNISRGMKDYTVLILFNVNRALYHTGQLLDNLFDYPQMVGADILFLENFPRPGAIPASDLYFDLGHIRAAQVMAYEGHTKFGYNPRMLKRIVVTNIINEKYVVAKKFLDLLNKSILHKKWAEHYRNYLFNESLIKSDSLIQLKRKLNPKFDFFIAVSKNFDKDLIRLLKENENNKMAFEYLMAYYLLDCRFEDLMEHLDKFKKLGYKKYPRHIEEALLLIRAVSPSESAKFDYSINEQTIERFKQFHSIRSKLKNEAEAKEVLRIGFFNTYWYYILYIRPRETDLE